MKTNFKSLAKLLFYLLPFIVGIISCNSSSVLVQDKDKEKSAEALNEYFSVKIDGVLWEAFPSKEFKEYKLSYKELGHSFLFSQRLRMVLVWIYLSMQQMN